MNLQNFNICSLYYLSWFDLWLPEDKVMHCFSRIYTKIKRNLKILFILLGIIACLTRFIVWFYFWIVPVISVLCVWTLAGLWMQKRCNKLSVSPMNTFISEFWQILLLSCLSAGVVDFAVLARLTEGLLGWRHARCFGCLGLMLVGGRALCWETSCPNLKTKVVDIPRSIGFKVAYLSYIFTRCLRSVWWIFKPTKSSSEVAPFSAWSMMLASELALAYEDWRLFDSTRFCFHFVVGVLFHISVFGHQRRRLGGFWCSFWTVVYRQWDETFTRTVC